MAFIITEACVASKSAACVAVCPVDCIYEGDDQYYIHPDECIDCGACEPECPVSAIYPASELPGDLTGAAAKTEAFFAS
jgi:NAD-dependent dihydropyrimidine dehydrogenase PreA subunit